MASSAADEQPAASSLTLSDKFFRYFQHEVTDLQEQMARIANHGTSGGERADAIDHCLSAISRLSSEVQEASSYIPNHDKRTYGEAIKALQNKISEVRAASQPRQKFSFKKSGPLFSTQKNESAISLNDAAELAKQQRKQLSDPLAGRSTDSSYVNTPADQVTPANELVEEEAGVEAEASSETTAAFTPDTPSLLQPTTARAIRQPSFSASTSVTLNSHRNAHIVLPTSASHATSSGTLSKISTSIIDMSSPTTGQPFATLTLKDITSSLVICGHVNGAAHLTNIKESVIVVASRQFRMHESRNCKVYLFTTSRPIIEDCHGIRFAPLPECHMVDSDKSLTNQWSNVDDFKWLRNEQSPNWASLDPTERIQERTWKEVVPGGHNLSVEDILKAVGIAV